MKLQSYWKKVCEDEKRSKQRNAQLLRDLDRMETNMANLEARREKLRQLKVLHVQYKSEIVGCLKTSLVILYVEQSVFA